MWFHVGSGSICSLVGNALCLLLCLTSVKMAVMPFGQTCSQCRCVVNRDVPPDEFAGRDLLRRRLVLSESSLRLPFQGAVMGEAEDGAGTDHDNPAQG